MTIQLAGFLLKAMQSLFATKGGVTQFFSGITMRDHGERAGGRGHQQSNEQTSPAFTEWRMIQIATWHPKEEHGGAAG